MDFFTKSFSSIFNYVFNTFHCITKLDFDFDILYNNDYNNDNNMIDNLDKILTISVIEDISSSIPNASFTYTNMIIDQGKWLNDHIFYILVNVKSNIMKYDILKNCSLICCFTNENDAIQYGLMKYDDVNIDTIKVPLYNVIKMKYCLKNTSLLFIES